VVQWGVKRTEEKIYFNTNWGGVYFPGPLELNFWHIYPDYLTIVLNMSDGTRNKDRAG